MASAGLEVLVLEKNKTFGGSFGENMEAFPEYHYSSLGLTVPAKPVNEVKIVCGESSERRRLKINFRSPVFRLVKRGPSEDSIDSYLYQRTIRTSAKILFSEKYESAKKKGDKIEVRTSHGSYDCSVLIAADGVFSKVRSTLRLAGEQKTEGVGYIAKVSGAKLERGETIGVFNYKRWPGSYCYIVGYPEQDYATVGITVRSPYANAVLKKYYDSLVDYLPDILGEARIVDATRGFVTLGSRNRILSSSIGSDKNTNVLLIGEAGGFQDPTLAFGLSPALSSARLAASCVVEACSKNDFGVLNLYESRARAKLVRDETRRLSFRYILESMTERELSAFLSVIARNPNRVEKVMRTGEYVFNFLPSVVRSAGMSPGMLTIPFRYIRVSRTLKSRQRGPVFKNLLRMEKL